MRLMMPSKKKAKACFKKSIILSLYDRLTISIQEVIHHYHIITHLRLERVKKMKLKTRQIPLETIYYHQHHKIQHFSVSHFIWLTIHIISEHHIIAPVILHCIQKLGPQTFCNNKWKAAQI